MLEGPRWTQFRRLLLGTMVELVQDAGLKLRLDDLELRFLRGSAFEVPRLNNHMRFVGEVRAGLHEPSSDEALAQLERTLQTVWPDLLAVVDIPIGDRLTSTKNETSAAVEGGDLVVRFDLVAD